MYFDSITDKESYWGEVVSVDDPKMASRVRIRVETIYDEIPVESIPWAIPRYADSAAHDLPAIGEIVQVKFLNDDIYFPTWYRIRSTTDKLSKDDYSSATVITEKDLSKYDLDGKLGLRWTKSEGLVIELLRNDKLSTVIIRNDNSIFMKNGNTEKCIHISNESISFGTETKSQQPSVVGDDTVTALKKLNQEIKDLSKEMNTGLSAIATAATSSPYTAHLTSPIKLYAKKVTSIVDAAFSDNDEWFPEVLSKCSTIDKE
jgi:hypothetical protein